MQLTVAVSAVLDRLRAVLTRHSDAPVALLLPRETFLLTDWGRHRRQQLEEYSVRTLPYASTGTVLPYPVYWPGAVATDHRCTATDVGAAPTVTTDL